MGIPRVYYSVHQIAMIYRPRDEKLQFKTGKLSGISRLDLFVQTSRPLVMYFGWVQMAGCGCQAVDRCPDPCLKPRTAEFI